MKLLLILTFLALVYIARSAPPSSSKDRTLILPNYHDEDEIHLLDDDIKDEDEMNTTTTTTTTTTRRSTYVFPTRNRNTYTSPPSRRPWLTQRTTSIKTTTVDVDEIDFYNEDEGGFKYFRNIREFFKKIFEDIKKLFRNLTGSDFVKAILQFFNRKDDDDN